MKKMLLIGILLFSALSANLISSAAQPPGVTTAPYFLTYTARLRDSAGVAVNTPHAVRFSVWSAENFMAGDIDGAGNINVAAPNFANWQETHVVVPNVEGIFTVQLGSINVLPNFNSDLERFLQVEVREALSPMTDFEILDPTGNFADGKNRKPLNSSPYAINADTVDNRDVGFGPGEIPYLNASGILNFDLLPGGVNQNTFIIDVENAVETAGTGSIKLQFGDTLNKFLEYDLDNNYFNFNDNVNITGNLTVNGVPIGPYDRSIVYEPLFADAVIVQDGTNNRGKLELHYIDEDGQPGNLNRNFYRFSTQQNDLQNLDLILRIKIPEGFNGFLANPLQIDYRTANANIAQNKVEVFLEDVTGTSVNLTGASDLASAAWNTADINFVGAPDFVAGEMITLKIKMSATNAGFAEIGKLRINYNGS